MSIENSEKEINYWWLVVDPDGEENWSFSYVNVGETDKFDLREDNGKYRKYFKEINVNDKIIGYETTTKQVVALCHVIKKDYEFLHIQKDAAVTQPVYFSQLKEYNELSDMMYLKRPNGGALSPLTKDQYDFIFKLTNTTNEQENSKILGENTMNQNENLGSANFEKVKELAEALTKSKNIILRGAPGTGKSVLAKQIANYMILGENKYKKRMQAFAKSKDSNIWKLTDEQSKQVEFVQFHPSYDYTDFVEGLRPKIDKKTKNMSFELENGIFKNFVNKAKNAYKQTTKVQPAVTETENVTEEDDESIKKIIMKFLLEASTSNRELYTCSKGEPKKLFYIKKNEKGKKNPFKCKIPDNQKYTDVDICIDKLTCLRKSGKKIDSLKVVKRLLWNNEKAKTAEATYYYALYQSIFGDSTTNIPSKEDKCDKNYVFIIDEINRGEISKIFGELFYSIDPDKRGEEGAVSTQYSNMHGEDEDKFYIPDNVYIIGTMNDIDRSVDTFDFAMRRRFRFIEIKADDTQYMLDDIANKEEIKNRMNNLNDAIILKAGLNPNYQIGGSYFKKLETLNCDALWNNYLEPLLEEYVRGMDNEKDIINSLKEKYNDTTAHPKDKSNANGSENN